ncbi:hypothetical protein C8E95_3973 [Pseudonocardia autotrophica]|uniref:Uncharacterized protein n=1 Tax=Pseudonocardia autotrophica TaxID=2074 RepID=A0A1Y2MPV1_PSEAH|nr:hypothetical protein BG845_04916 [Pseudonocardia autotrophica]TDN74843.1 hypothetical protein C8E95_3973 [Pseudonocardia autotrophica]
MRSGAGFHVKPRDARVAETAAPRVGRPGSPGARVGGPCAGPIPDRRPNSPGSLAPRSCHPSPGPRSTPSCSVPRQRPPLPRPPRSAPLGPGSRSPRRSLLDHPARAAQSRGRPVRHHPVPRSPDLRRPIAGHPVRLTQSGPPIPAPPEPGPPAPCRSVPAQPRVARSASPDPGPLGPVSPGRPHPVPAVCHHAPAVRVRAVAATATSTPLATRRTPRPAPPGCVSTNRPHANRPRSRAEVRVQPITPFMIPVLGVLERDTRTRTPKTGIMDRDRLRRPSTFCSIAQTHGRASTSVTSRTGSATCSRGPRRPSPRNRGFRRPSAGHCGSAVRDSSVEHARRADAPTRAHAMPAPPTEPTGLPRSRGPRNPSRLPGPSPQTPSGSAELTVSPPPLRLAAIPRLPG